MLYVTCKNPECRGEIKAPFSVRAHAAFSRVVNAEISCPYCRATTTYARADLHPRRPTPPAPIPTPDGASGRASGGPTLR